MVKYVHLVHLSMLVNYIPQHSPRFQYSLPIHPRNLLPLRRYILPPGPSRRLPYPALGPLEPSLMGNRINPLPSLDDSHEFIEGFGVADSAPTPKDDEFTLGTGKCDIHPSPVLKEISDVVVGVGPHKGDDDNFLVAALESVCRMDFHVGMVRREDVREQFYLRAVD